MDKHQILEVIAQLETIDLSTVSLAKRREITYSLLFPSVFPTPPVMVQSYFSNDHIMRWVVSVLPEGAISMIYDEWKPSLLPEGARHLVSSECRHELLDTAYPYWVVAEILIRGEFKTLGIQLPRDYTSGKSRESVLADMRSILGPIYQKELYSMAPNGAAAPFSDRIV